MRLIVAPGVGRTRKSADIVSFTAAPSPELEAALDAAEPDRLFKQLAGLVVGSDFACPPFVVVRLGDDPRLFAYGDLELRVGDDTLDPSQASTWIEQSIEPDTVVSVGDPAELSDFGDCLLVEGVAAASAIQLRSSEVEPVFDITPQTNEWVEQDERPHDVNSITSNQLKAAAPESEPLAASAEPLTGSKTPPEQTTPHPIDDVSVDEEDPSVIDEDDDFDPFAEPESVNLELIGSTAPEVDLDTEPEVSLDPAPAAIESDEDEVEPEIVLVDNDPPGLLSEPTLPPESPIDEVDDAVAPMFRPPPSSPPPLANTAGSAPDGIRPPPTNLPPAIIGAGPSTEPAVPKSPQEGAAVLRVDDGQSFDIEEGVYVGRYPSKRGLPAGFDEVVVQGEGVSRVHWALVREVSGAYAVEDLGSTGGTATIGPDGVEQPLPTNARRIIGPGTRITFGDRWAIFER